MLNMKNRSLFFPSLPSDNATLYHQLFMLFIALMFILLSVYGNYTLFFQMNKYHTRSLDNLFTWITLFGNGMTNLLTAALLLLILKKKSPLPLQVFLSFIVSGLAVQILKPIFHAPRPSLAISHVAYQHFLPGITRSGFTSFPSGHTTTIFALCTILALNTSNKFYQFLLFIIALITGYSRIYLGSHFPIDVMAGALLGYGTALLIYNLNPVFRFKKTPSVNNQHSKSESGLNKKLSP